MVLCAYRCVYRPITFVSTHGSMLKSSDTIHSQRRWRKASADAHTSRRPSQWFGQAQSYRRCVVDQVDEMLRLMVWMQSNFNLPSCRGPVNGIPHDAYTPHVLVMDSQQRYILNRRRKKYTCVCRNRWNITKIPVFIVYDRLVFDHSSPGCTSHTNDGTSIS